MPTEIPDNQDRRTPVRAKILLVDDTPHNLVALEAALEGLGQDLVLAKSGTKLCAIYWKMTSPPSCWM